MWNREAKFQRLQVPAYCSVYRQTYYDTPNNRSNTDSSCYPWRQTLGPPVGPVVPTRGWKTLHTSTSGSVRLSPYNKQLGTEHLQVILLTSNSLNPEPVVKVLTHLHLLWKFKNAWSRISTPLIRIYLYLSATVAYVTDSWNRDFPLTASILR